MTEPRPRTIPEATVARLAVYLRVLTGLSDGGRDTVSSGELASAAGVNPAGLRKDLSHLGPCGVRGVGYEVATLRNRIAAVLGGERSRACVLVGIGNLGAALGPVAAEAGLEPVAVDVDADRELQAEYGDRVPVVLLDGREHSYFEVDVDGDPDLQAEFGDRVPVVLLDGREHGYFTVDVPRLRRDLGLA